jgi:hypothetical protein
VHVTGLDMSVYPGFDEEKRNLYPDACPPDLLKRQAERYGELFRDRVAAISPPRVYVLFRRAAITHDPPDE